jgi:hypothetical protein
MFRHQGAILLEFIKSNYLKSNTLSVGRKVIFNKQEKQCTYNVTMRCGRENIVAVEKQ